MIHSEQLASFIVFAEELNFTRAAARLHVSQPALHVQIKKLSAALGVTLYRRAGRGIELTPQGLELLAFGREQRDRTEAFLSRLGKPAVEHVVVAAGEGTLLYLLDEPIARLSREPGVRVRALTRDREGTLAAVLSGEAHLGVAPLDVVPDGIEAELLTRVGFHAVMPRGHALARKRRLLLRHLANERLVLPPADRPHRAQIARALAAQGLECDVALEATGWELMLRFASRGLGVAIVNDFCRVPRGAVARRVTDLPGLRYFLLARRGGAPPRPGAARLRALIIEAFRERRSARTEARR